MSAALRAELAKGEQSRIKDFKAMMSDIEKFLADVTKNVSNMIKGFQKEHKEMAHELKASLEKGETGRLKDFESMMADIREAIKEIETFVANKLEEFDAAHTDMSGELKKELAKYVNDMINATKRLMSDIQRRQKERNMEVADLLQEFQTEREKMAANWQKLTETMFKRRGGRIPRVKVEAAEEVKTVEEAIASKGKAKKKSAEKSKGSQQKVPVGV